MGSTWIFLKRVLGSLVVLCPLLMVGCDQMPVTRQALPSVQLASSAWESISLPISGTPLRSYSVSPSDPQTVYACIGAPGTSHGLTSITLWRTRDAGKHWSPLPLPPTTGTGCSLSIAFSQPERIAFLVTDTYDDQHPCDHNTLYLSTNSGASWLPVSYASIVSPSATYGECAITVTSHHLYLWYSYKAIVKPYIGGQKALQLSRLERSDNDGITWSPASTDFGLRSFFFPPQVGDDETLLVSVKDLPITPETTSILWMSHDAGRSWQQLGVIHTPGSFLLTSHQQGISGLTALAPFYALIAEQLPSALYNLKVLQNAKGQHWSVIPPLPVSGTSGEHPGLLQALAVTNDGHLLAFGVNPKIGLPSSFSGQQSTFWLWIWNPRVSRWQVLSAPLTHPAEEECGLCWFGQLTNGPNHTTYLYVYHWEEKSNLFRIRLPDF